MARGEWDWDSGDDDDNVGGSSYNEFSDLQGNTGSFGVIPEIDKEDGLIDTGDRKYEAGGWGDMQLRGPSEARLAQYEQAYSPRKAFISGTGGMTFGLQDFDRAGWGNPFWRYYPGQMPEQDLRGQELADIGEFDERGEALQKMAGEPPEPLTPGHTAMFAPEAKFYTDPRYRPWYDFTVGGGGWMPESFDEIIGGDTIIPERAILGNFATEDYDTDDDEDDDDDDSAAARRKATAPNSERGILGPRQLAARRRRSS